MDPTNVVGRRVAAFILDLILTSVVQLAVFLSLAVDQQQAIRSGQIDLNETVYGNLTLGDTTYSVYGGSAGLYFLLVLVFGVAYWVALPGAKGWTPGKLALGIRVQKEDGSGAPGFGRSFARQFLWLADAFPYLIPYLTGFVCALASDRHRRLGDRVASTVVVRKDAFGQPVAAPAPADGTVAAPPPLAPEFQPRSDGPPNWPS